MVFRPTVVHFMQDFDIDITQLERRYFTAQKQFHPDRFVGKPAEVRTKAAGQSMLINDAYQVLKSPLKRAQHLLTLNGIAVGDERDAVKPTHDLLEEIMEIREKLSEIGASGEVDALRKDVEKSVDATIAGISQAFRQKDLPNAAQMTIRLGYLLKIMDEIRIQTKRFDTI